MIFDEQYMKGLMAIYKYVYNNPNTHRNIIRKNLIHDGKVSSKEKFFKLFDSLLALGTLTMDRELVAINPKIMEVGVLKKERTHSYVVTPKSNKHFKVDKNFVLNYSSGDVLDLIVTGVGKERDVIVLGKRQKKKQNEQCKTEHKTLESCSNKLNKEINLNMGKDEGLVLGRVVKISHDNLVFIPNKKSLPTRQIPILNSKKELSAFQDKICVMKLDNADIPVLGGFIVSVKGNAGNPVHEYDAIAENYGAIMNWNGAQNEIAKIPSKVDTQSLSLISEQDADTRQRGNVVDLRHIPFVTIDPATCKDMDDAIYSTYDENGDTVVYTAVANVTKYVDLDSTIGERYANGAFTIYAPNKAYSILPSELSTGICSLNPNEDRLAFVVKTILNSQTGEVKASKIYDAIINSKQKYSYEQAQEIVDSIDTEEARPYIVSKLAAGEELSLEEQLFMNYYAAETIKRGFAGRRMLRFNLNKEREIVFDEGLQDVVDIKPVPHLQYHEVIESFMITANEATAKYAQDNHLKNIYRIHEKPNPKKADRADEFFNILGIDFDKDISAESLNQLLKLIKGNSNEEEINAFLIKMQSRAKYSGTPYGDIETAKSAINPEELISHFALQSKHYSHTTSPIRRIVDYVTQYNILANMHGTQPLSANVINRIVENANERQLEVDQAEKDFDDISSVLYCEKHIGERFSGRISKVRYASVVDGYEDDIVVIAKEDSKGIFVEIPLSQVIGKHLQNCTISEQGCAVYDDRGHVVLTICKPIDFVIDKASRQTMTVTAKTNKTLVNEATAREQASKDYRGKKHRYHAYLKKNNHSKPNANNPLQWGQE